MNNQVSFGFGVVSCLAVVSTVLLGFILFCPVWDEWTNPESVQPEVQVHMEAPHIFFIPTPTEPVNMKNETPSGVPPIFKKND